MPDRIPEEVFVAAVAEATKRAVRALSRQNQVRLVGLGFLIGVAIACIIAIPTTVWLTREGDQGQRNAERANSQQNCSFITAIARIGEQQLAHRIPEVERFKRESSDRLGLTPQRFDELIKHQREEEEQRLSVYRGIASVNCAKAIS